MEPLSLFPRHLPLPSRFDLPDLNQTETELLTSIMTRNKEKEKEKERIKESKNQEQIGTQERRNNNENKKYGFGLMSAGMESVCGGKGNGSMLVQPRKILVNEMLTEENVLAQLVQAVKPANGVQYLGQNGNQSKQVYRNRNEVSQNQSSEDLHFNQGSKRLQRNRMTGNHILHSMPMTSSASKSSSQLDEVQIVRDRKNETRSQYVDSPVVQIQSSSLALLKSKMKLRSLQNDEKNVPQVMLHANQTLANEALSTEFSSSALALLKKRMLTQAPSERIRFQNESLPQPAFINQGSLSLMNENSNLASNSFKTPSIAALNSPTLKKVKGMIKEAEVIVLDGGLISVGGYQYNPSEAETIGDLDLMQCPDCERKFNPQSFEKHRKVCKQVFKEKEEEKIESPKVERKLNIKWKKNSESFRNALRAAREYQEAIKLGNNPPRPPMMDVDEDFVECPHCQRRFAPATAARHMPHCANTKAKPTMLQRKKKEIC